MYNYSRTSYTSHLRIYNITLCMYICVEVSLRLLPEKVTIPFIATAIGCTDERRWPTVLCIMYSILMKLWPKQAPGQREREARFSRAWLSLRQQFWKMSDIIPVYYGTIKNKLPRYLVARFRSLVWFADNGSRSGVSVACGGSRGRYERNVTLTLCAGWPMDGVSFIVTCSFILRLFCALYLFVSIPIVLMYTFK